MNEAVLSTHFLFIGLESSHLSNEECFLGGKPCSVINHINRAAAIKHPSARREGF